MESVNNKVELHNWHLNGICVNNKLESMLNTLWSDIIIWSLEVSSVPLKLMTSPTAHGLSSGWNHPIKGQSQSTTKIRLNRPH